MRTNPGELVLHGYLSELCSLDPSQFATEDITEALRGIGHSERAEGEPMWPIFGTVLRCVNTERARRINNDRDEAEEQRITEATKRTIAKFASQTHRGYEPMDLANESPEFQERAARLQRILNAR
jgi:hypothetical protein